ncbi:MAG TPA: hypothetical protein VHE35_07990 [Kofleriaceae bacterium]|nr:hypothetical protein [Kofleriaceae bacterium]
MSRSLLLAIVPAVLALAPATSRAGFGDPIGNFNIRAAYVAAEGGGLALDQATSQVLFGLDACKEVVAAVEVKNHAFHALFAIRCASEDGPQLHVLEQLGRVRGLLGDPDAGQVELIVDRATAQVLGGDELLDILSRLHNPASGWSTFPQDLKQVETIALPSTCRKLSDGCGLVINRLDFAAGQAVITMPESHADDE